MKFAGEDVIFEGCAGSVRVGKDSVTLAFASGSGRIGYKGQVSVASTHLAGERTHVVLPYSHTWLGWHRTTTAQVKYFLREGRFDAP